MEIDVTEVPGTDEYAGSYDLEPPTPGRQGPITRRDDTVILRGQSHKLIGMPASGSLWVGMVVVKSPTDSALLKPYEALALRDWLNERLAGELDADRPDHDDVECQRAHDDQHALDLCPACYAKHFVLPASAPVGPHDCRAEAEAAEPKSLVPSCPTCGKGWPRL